MSIIFKKYPAQTQARTGQSVSENTVKKSLNVIDRLLSELPSIAAANSTAHEEAVRAIVGVLDLETDIRRGFVRWNAIRILEKAGVPNAKNLVATAFDTASDSDNNLPAAAFALPEPYQGTVIGAELLDGLRDVFRRYLSLPPYAAEALALWVVHTYAHDCAEISAILAVTSPTPRCGKTSLLTFLQRVCAKAVGISNMSAATVYGLIKNDKPTLIIDEADTFLKADDMRGILNSGFARQLAFVCRSIGGEATLLSTWAPKAIACIGKLPDTLQDRSITVHLQRKSTAEKLDRLGDADPRVFTTFQSKAFTWVTVNEAQLRAARPEIPGGLDDRACDKWRPLLAIADVTGGHWPQTARAAAMALSGAAEQNDDSTTAMLLADLQNIFSDGTRQLPTTEILQRLVRLDERPWARYRHGRAISPFDLSRLLGPFGVKSRSLRISVRATAKGYTAEDLTPVFARYATQSGTPAHQV